MDSVQRGPLSRSVAQRRRAAAGSDASSSPRRKPSNWSGASGSSATCLPRRGNIWLGSSVSPRTRWRSGSRTTATRWSGPAGSRTWTRFSCYRTVASPSRSWCGRGSCLTDWQRRTWRRRSGPAWVCLCAPFPLCCTPGSGRNRPGCRRRSSWGCSSWRTCSRGAGEAGAFPKDTYSQVHVKNVLFTHWNKKTRPCFGQRCGLSGTLSSVRQ